MHTAGPPTSQGSPQPTDPDHARQSTDQPSRRLSRVVVTGCVLLVFGLNVVILGYAVWLSRPGPDAAGGPVLSAALALAAGAPSAAGESPATFLRPLGPAQVVNIVDLPSPAETIHLFVRHCAACHGLDGRGSGPAAAQLYPKPRDFVNSPFRFASTGRPRDEVVATLERTISQGVPRSAMPGFGNVLSELHIAGLARHVLTLREQQGEPASAEPTLDLGRHPPATAQLITRGPDTVPADFEISTKQALRDYEQQPGLAVEQVGEHSLALMVASWLSELTDATTSDDFSEPTRMWIIQSGLFEALKGGQVKQEAQT